MLTRKLITALAALLLIAGTIYSVVRLISLRMETGDVYPRYSTLRADPLGMRALFEAIDQLPDRSGVRNYRPLQNLRPRDAITLIYPAVPHRAEWGRDELHHFEELVANGSRAVFAFAPADVLPPERSPKKPAETEPPKDAKAEKSDTKSAEGEPGKEAERPSEDDAGKSNQDVSGSKEERDKKESEKGDKRKGKEFPALRNVPFSEAAERWGFKFKVVSGKKAGSFHGSAKLEPGQSNFEPEISWHSALRFEEAQPSWRVLYRVNNEPVIMERSWGDGTIVLCSDCYLLSNEGLQSERCPNVLSWLIGTPREVVFDEEHLGVAESIGIIDLAKKYHLKGAIAATAVVLLLWFWMQLLPLVPDLPADDKNVEYVAGLDSHAGFVSLLRRSIAPARVLDACVEEWRRAFHHEKRMTQALDHVLQNQPEGKAKPDTVAIYHSISAALAPETRSHRAQQSTTSSSS